MEVERKQQLSLDTVNIQNNLFDKIHNQNLEITKFLIYEAILDTK
jgi:hypothetical protein